MVHILKFNSLRGGVSGQYSIAKDRMFVNARSNFNFVLMRFAYTCMKYTQNNWADLQQN